MDLSVKTSIKAVVTALAATAATALLPATAAHAEGQNRVGLAQQRTSSSGIGYTSFAGLLNWDGSGNYTINGVLQATCSPDARPTTVWLEHAGQSQPWQLTGKAGCDHGGYGRLPVSVSGHVSPREKLQIRLGTWQSSRFESGTTSHSEEMVFDISS